MQINDLIQKLLFKLKYRKNISCPFNATGYKDIFIKKNTSIKAFASLQAHRGDSKGKIYISDNTKIGEFLKIVAGAGNVFIGKDTIIGSKATLLGGGNINIGNKVLISHNVVIASSSHDFSNTKIPMNQTPDTFKPIKINDNVFIGANSTILMGVAIEEGAIIGAGSIVPENTFIDRYEIWCGNPAKFRRSRIPLKGQIENEMVKYLKKYPFHNLFILYNINIFATEYGGTCSDRTIHFLNKLKERFNNIFDIKLHIAKINNKKTHIILRIIIDEKIYFCDVGMGYPITKLLPSENKIQFTSYGITFRTIVEQDKLIVFINENNGNGEKELMTIDFKEQNQKAIEQKIKNRNKYIKDIPLSKKLRYFFIHGDEFYKIMEE